MAINQEMTVHYNFDDQVLEIIPTDGFDGGVCISAKDIVKFGFRRNQEPFSDIEDLEKELESCADMAFVFRGWRSVHKAEDGGR